MVPAEGFAAEIRTIYWDLTSGADTNTGATEADPVKTAEAAYAALSGADEGRIVLLSTLTLTEETNFPECDIPVTLTGAGITSSKNVLFHGPTTLENMTLQINAASNSTFISAEGNDLTVGENVTTPAYTSGSTKYYFCLAGRYSEGSVEGMQVTVKSGTWRNIYAAGYKNAVIGNVKLAVTGGTVINNIAPAYSAAVTGNVDMDISGVTVQTNICGTPSGSAAVLTGNVNITLGDGVNANNLKVTKTASGKVTGKVTVTVDGNCSQLDHIIHGTSSGTAGSTELILKSGVLATTPCAFDSVTVDVPAGKNLTLAGCTVTATTAKTAGRHCLPKLSAAVFIVAWQMRSCKTTPMCPHLPEAV